MIERSKSINVMQFIYRTFEIVYNSTGGREGGRAERRGEGGMRWNKKSIGLKNI